MESSSSSSAASAASSSSAASASASSSRQARGKSAAGTWQWARTAETQRALLDAAREVFVEQGFSAASIAEVVERAGSSVGSLYHHFGGKSELYVALWQEYQQAQEQAAAGAVAAAKRAGVTDPFELFAAGARAYLEGSWQHRDLTMLFLSGDTPPGFGVMARTRGHQWISQNDTLLGLSDTSFDRLYATILTSLIGEGAREVAVAKNRQQANRVADAVIEYVQRIMADGPWSPPVKPVGADRGERAGRGDRGERRGRADRGARRASASRADAGSAAD